MKRSITLLSILLALAILVAPVRAKGAVDRITVSGPGLDEPIVLGKDTPEMETLNPWFGGFLGEMVEALPKGPLYTVDFYMNFSASGAADMRHIYTATYIPDPAGGAGYFYIPGRGDKEYELNKGTIMAAERDGKWHRASDSWEAALGPALAAAGIAGSNDTAGQSALPVSRPALVSALVVALLIAAGFAWRRHGVRTLVRPIAKTPER